MTTIYSGLVAFLLYWVMSRVLAISSGVSISDEESLSWVGMIGLGICTWCVVFLDFRSRDQAALYVWADRFPRETWDVLLGENVRSLPRWEYMVDSVHILVVDMPKAMWWMWKCAFCKGEDGAGEDEDWVVDGGVEEEEEEEEGDEAVHGGAVGIEDRVLGAEDWMEFGH